MSAFLSATVPQIQTHEGMEDFLTIRTLSSSFSIAPEAKAFVSAVAWSTSSGWRVLIQCENESGSSSILHSRIFANSGSNETESLLTSHFQLADNKPELREKMWHIASLLQNGLKELGYDIGDTRSPITPVYVPAGDVETGMAMLRMLREDYGVFVSGVMYPVVPIGVALFRMIPTASHTEEDVSRTLEAYKQMRDRMKLDLSQKPSKLNR